MKHIDIEREIREGNVKALKKLPNFLIRIIERIIYQDKTNAIFDACEGLEGVDFQNKLIEIFKLKLDIQGQENLPDQSKVILFANHPFGILDGMIASKITLDKYGDFKGIGNDAFRFVPNLKPYVVNVNAYGRTSKESINELEEALKSDVAINHFPAGEVSRHYQGKIQDREWRKSLVSRAVAHKRDLVPLFFYGRNSRLFYAINLIRRLFFIKLNLELSLLPHEMFNKKGKTIKVLIGKPIPYTVFNDKLKHAEWTEKVKRYLYEIGKNADTEKEFC
jgi:putative hemolysin